MCKKHVDWIANTFWMVNIKFLIKTMLQICILPSFSTTIFFKNKRHMDHIAHLKKTIPCNIPFCSICYFLFKLWVHFWGTSIGPLFMNGFNSIESTLLEDPCTAISQTVTVLLLKKKELKNQCIPMLNFKPLTGFLVLVRW